LNIILLFLGFILIENIILSKFFKTSSLFDESKKEKENFMLVLAVILDITLSSLITYFIYTTFLISINIEYIKTIIFIIVVLSFTQILKVIIKKYKTSLYDLLFNYALAIINCALFGIVLLNIQSEYTLTNVLVYSLLSSIGYMFSIYVFESIRERM